MMTVCIAAACDGGTRIVTATDGMISVGEVSADTITEKMFWLGDWQFLYAGTPANISLISENIDEAGMSDPNLRLTRRNIQSVVSKAYKKFVGELSSFDVLNAFGMTLEEFKANGPAFFGKEFHGQLVRQIKYNAERLQDQLLVLGWGLSPISVMLYELSPGGPALHSVACFAAIGSGAHLAQTTMMLLGQRRECTLAETIFNVAAAKFSSEKSAGLDVGYSTTIYVSHKRTERDATGKPCGSFLTTEDIGTLRELWTEYLKPRIPDEARRTITKIAASVSDGQTTIKDMVDGVMAETRLAAKRQTIQAVSPSPQSPTDDPSRQPPSQESPGGTDES